MTQILIDIEKTANLHSGLGQFSLHYALSMQKYAKDLDFRFYAKRKMKIPALESDKICYANILSKKPRPQLWHALHQFPKTFPPKGVPFLLTIHDLNFLHEKNKSKKQKYLRKLQQNIDKADAISVISDYTKSQLEQHIDTKGKTIQRIHNGVELNAFPQAERPQFLPKNPYFFSIGIISEKKNFHQLLPLMKAFPDYSLVIAGQNTSTYAQKIRDLAEEKGVEKQLILPGAISEEEKYYLYSHAAAFFFPSKAEGFGMPVIEAMHAGIPVIANNACSLPEVGGDIAFYWDSFEEEAMINTVNQALKSFQDNPVDYAARAKKHAANFSYEKSISQYINYYKKLLKVEK
jgi:glycosyltransferase involved in cell wall biosynthesis